MQIRARLLHSIHGQVPLIFTIPQACHWLSLLYIKNMYLHRKYSHGNMEQQNILIM